MGHAKKLLHTRYRVNDLERTIRFYAERPTQKKGAQEWNELDFDPATAAYRDYARAQSQPRKRGPRGHPDEHYRRVAYLYLKLYQAGARPLLVVLGQQLQVPAETARDWVHRARELGFLSPGKQGRKGATPGPRLREPDETDLASDGNTDAPPPPNAWDEEPPF